MTRRRPNPNPRGFDDNESAADYARRRRAERRRAARAAAENGDPWGPAALAQLDDDEWQAPGGSAYSEAPR